MPRSGSMTLSDFAGRRFAVECQRCARAGSYDADRMRAERGDVRLTDLLADLTANCPRPRALRLHDRCAARFAFS